MWLFRRNRYKRSHTADQMICRITKVLQVHTFLPPKKENRPMICASGVSSVTSDDILGSNSSVIIDTDSFSGLITKPESNDDSPGNEYSSTLRLWLPWLFLI